MLRTLVYVLLLLATSAHAGGSFTVDVEFSPIKQQIPELWHALNESFDLAKSGSASMIGNNVNQRLGHHRVGPYCLAGKPKDRKGGNTLMFCFVTEYTWLDDKGEMSTLEDAFGVREKFVSLEITPMED